VGEGKLGNLGEVETVVVEDLIAILEGVIRIG
jgi:hypothetical protein